MFESATACASADELFSENSSRIAAANDRNFIRLERKIARKTEGFLILVWANRANQIDLGKAYNKHARNARKVFAGDRNLLPGRQFILTSHDAGH